MVMITKSHNWIGIDLGTYNSSAAMKSRKGSVEIIKSLGDKTKSRIPFMCNREQYKEFPSFIYFNADGTLSSVGMESKARAHQEPELVVWGIKRLLGKTFTELKESGELERYPYRIKPDRRNGQCLISIGEKSYTPVQLCAEIFKKIKDDAKLQMKEDTDSLIVSVPAYFDPIRVTPIVEAARLAGFVHIKTIPEPVAAALAYNIDVTARPIKVIVFDFGAGTLDVTAGFLFRQADQDSEFKFHVMKNTGDPKLGGIDIDDRLVRVIKDKCSIENLSALDLAKLRRVAEIIKIRLSEESQVQEKFMCGSEEHCVQVSQFELQSAMEGRGTEKNLLEECRRQVMAAIIEAGWLPQEIELLLMIGGPTKLPCVHDIFKIIFNSNPLVLQQLNEFYCGSEKVDRMTAVSIGATISQDLRVEDRVPHGHGIEDVEINEDSIVLKPNILVPRDSAYPFKSKTYVIPWINLNGLFEFKIIQHVPKSEIQQFGYEYRFVGIQKFSVRNSTTCMIAIQMGYNANKELEVIIKNVFTNETATYVGVNQSACIGMNYPLNIKKPPMISKAQDIKKVPPAPETIDRFLQWANYAINFVQRKHDNSPVQQMLISQMLDEIRLITQRREAKLEWENVYNRLNSLIWNANTKGLLKQEEHTELVNKLSEYETELFRMNMR
ncbi:MAG: hypothetical protein A2Y62_13885 [Candidatus Fischerbacteria bacterium RBG_13_37_8]|uniref:Molecular chaperone DnaK n=1 Tax=Candidatus Fischerbacteria bacterium RBG_13_37_8 TaxID=1817863 RepID=A0A1F5VXA4_9BACT|nr:MAG: hypothetical protein A2Y62_13885 [Candidatus Fischerbacteria bacterium RBG_13_37_8]